MGLFSAALAFAINQISLYGILAKIKSWRTEKMSFSSMLSEAIKLRDFWIYLLTGSLSIFIGAFVYPATPAKGVRLFLILILLGLVINGLVMLFLIRNPAEDQEFQ